MVMTRSSLAKNLWPGILFHWGDAYNTYPEQWPEIFDRRTSTKAYEEMVGEYQFGLAPTKAEGKGVSYDDAGLSWTARVQHETYALGFQVTLEAQEDDQYWSLVPKYTRALKRSMLITKEIRGAAVLNRAFNGSYTGGDGKALCASDHPLKLGGSWSNLGASVDLNETALEQAIVAIGDWVDERGLAINLRAVKLIIGNGQQFTAERLMQTNGRVGTSDNDINALRSTGAIPQGYRVNNFISDRNAWWLKTDAPEGLLHFQRVALGIQEGDSFDNDVMKVKARERYSFGWADARGIYGSPGT